MKILNVVDMNPNKRGPVELQLLETGRRVVARGGGFACWFTSAAPDWYSSEMADAGIDLGVLEGEWAASVLHARRVVKPDIVHFHHGPHAGMSEVAAEGVIVVRTEHGPRATPPTRILRSIVRHHRTRAVDHFVAVSEFIARQIVIDFLVPRRKITVILNGTDIERFQPRPDDKLALRRELFGSRVQPDDVLITLAAQMGPAKRQWMLVEAMAELSSVLPSARAVIAGNGPDRASIEELVGRLRLADRVIVLTGDNDVAAIYAASDIAALPSTAEGLPGSGIEALACGLPLVATPNGGTPEVYEDGISGVSVTDQTPRGLANALVPLIESAEMRVRMGAAGRKRAEQKFSLSRPADKTVALYDWLGRRQPVPTADLRSTSGC
jgi:glycosyltransferase involved in cell wall biosynthesis